MGLFENNNNNNNIVSFKSTLNSNSKQCQGRKKVKSGGFVECINKSERYCIDHNQTLCIDCCDNHDSNLGCESIPIEEYFNISFYLKFGDVVKQFFELNPDLCKNTIINNIDRRNKFIYVNSDEGIMNYGQKFINGGGLLDKDPFLVVSFIGNSGGGKSSTVGSLCIESDNHPIPSYTNSESTSSDINSYLGDAEIVVLNNQNNGDSDNSSIDSNSIACDNFSDNNSENNYNSIGGSKGSDNGDKYIKKLKYLIFDSEGFGGTPPSVNEDTSSNSGSDSFNCDDGIINNDENKRDISQYKYDWVQVGYPRLLFLISDILIYTHGGSNREKELILARILNASEVSSSNSNNLFKPHLIILFTKNEVGEEFQDIEFAKQDFLKNCKKSDIEKLELLYQSVSVIYTSSINQNLGLSRYIKDIDLQLLNATGIKENNVIQKVLRNRIIQESANLSFSNKQHFNDCFNNAVCLYKYFELEYTKFINKGHTNISSFNLAFSCLESVLIKNYKKFQKENHLEINSIVEDYVFVLNFVSKLLIEKSPCDYLIDQKYQCINHKDSHPYHQSKEMETKYNSFIKTIFGKPKSYKAPFISKGKHQSKIEKYDLTQFLEKRINKNELKKVSPDGPILTSPGNEVRNCESFCISCILRKPTIHYSCGHIICLNCVKENSKSGECIIKDCDGSVINKKDLDFNPAIGCRILSIDGGGIKSISQCIALHIMKEELYGIEIHDLFDLIVGMNTGGFIAICLLTSKNELNQIINLFTEFIRINSKYDQLSFDKYFEISDQLLKNEIGESLLKQCYSKTRLLIPSYKITEKSIDEIIYVNYDKVSNSVDKYESSIASYKVAINSMLPLFVSKVFGTTIAKCFRENPASFAMDEYKSIWGQSCKNIDTFLSLGSGVFATKDIINSILSYTKESKSNSLLEELNESNKSILDHNVNLFRINGKFKNEDNWETIDKLQSNLNEIQSNYSNDKSLFSSINKSLSSLFYLSDLSYSNNELSGIISCRLNSIPIQIIDQLNEKYQKFYLVDSDESNSEFKIISKVISPLKFSISFIITSPSDIIDIRCSLVSKSRSVNNTSISSCPFSIKDDLKYFNINNKPNKS